MISEKEIRDIENVLGPFTQRCIYMKKIRNRLKHFLVSQGFKILSSSHKSDILSKKIQLKSNELFLQTRTKTNEKILKKMQRYNETPNQILDIYGIRIVVSEEKRIDELFSKLQDLWKIPTKEEMTIRRGTLVFAWKRDYRKRNWIGYSKLSSSDYDKAIHCNLKTEYGIVEIQIMDQDLFQRAFSFKSDASHREFKRRQTNFYKYRHS
jgi:ppGpp synthetase/RelA/SpoT-type nucleotidyltranferase